MLLNKDAFASFLSLIGLVYFLICHAYAVKVALHPLGSDLDSICQADFILIKPD